MTTVEAIVKATYEWGYHFGVESSDGYHPPQKKEVEKVLKEATTQILKLINEAREEVKRDWKEWVWRLPHEGKDLEIVINSVREIEGFIMENTPEELREEK